jgi:hypothetical protein
MAGTSILFAERVGFEPTVQCNPYDDLANRSFRPLRHLSVFPTVFKTNLWFVAQRAVIRKFGSRGKFSTTPMIQTFNWGGKNRDLLGYAQMGGSFYYRRGGRLAGGGDSCVLEEKGGARSGK